MVIVIEPFGDVPDFQTFIFVIEIPNDEVIQRPGAVLAVLHDPASLVLLGEGDVFAFAAEDFVWLTVELADDEDPVAAADLGPDDVALQDLGALGGG